MNFKDSWPLRGRWLRHFLVGLWFCLGIALVLVGSTLTNPPNLVLSLAFWLGIYMTIRSVVYWANRK